MSQKRKERQTARALERSRSNQSGRKHKSPSKQRRLERRAAERAAGVVKECRSFFSPIPSPESLSKRQKSERALEDITKMVVERKTVRLQTLQDMNKKDLSALAAKHEVPGRSKMTKDELVVALGDIPQVDEDLPKSEETDNG